MKSSILLGIIFVFAPLSLRAQAPDASTFSLSPGDVTEATVITSDPARLKVTLTPAKSEALAAFTEINLKKQVQIVVVGKLRAEPFIRERMMGPSMELYVSSPEDALATVKALLTSNLTFDQLQKWTDFSGTHYAEKLPPRSAGPGPATKPTSDPGSTRLLKELQGSWIVTKASTNGKESHDRAFLEGNWKFEGDELIVESRQKGTGRFTLEIDGTANPKAFHLTSTEPAKAGSGWMLFLRETNTLRIAFYDNLEGRPESFEPRESRSELKLVVVTLAPKK